MIQIKPVNSKAEKKQFVKVASDIQLPSSVWIRPLDSVISCAIDMAKNPFYDDGKGQAFIAMKDNKVVGRILAHISNRHHKLHSERAGYFGLFECANDQHVASALFQAAENFLRDNDCDVIRGPFNITAAQEMGIVTDGFDHEPAVDMTYTPDYYPHLFTENGFSTCLKMSTWRNEDISTLNVTDLAGGRLQKCDLKDFKIRPLNSKNKKQDMDLIWELVNAAFIGNWGFVPINHEEWLAQIGPILPIIDPSLIKIAETQGIPIGVTFAVPDFNEDLKHMNGRLLHPRLLRMMRPQSHHGVEIILFAVRKQFQGKGISRLLNAELVKTMQSKGFKRLSITWIADENKGSQAQASSLNMSLLHKLVMYEKPL